MKWLAVFALIPLFASAAGPGAPETAIRSLLTQQVDAWNHGDIRAFVSPYAEPCTLVGKTVSKKTRAAVLAHYQQKYPSPGAMGKLDFSALTVEMLNSQTAIVTGQWHLARDRASRGPVGGVFSLVVALREGRWQIVLDHTS